MGDAQHSKELRTDWLKLRGCLFDPVTRLPSLPAVIDLVRRRLEEGEQMGLLYFDLSNGGHGEPISGWQVHDQLIGWTAEALRTSHQQLLTDGDVIAQVGVRSDEFVVFAGLGHVNGGSGRHLEQLHLGLSESVRALLEERVMGEVHVHLDSAGVPLELVPAVRIERAIYSSVARARENCRQADEERQSERSTELRRMLETGDVLIRYQPIVDLETQAIHGFEALSSAPTSEPFENPEMLFSFAEESDGIVALERLCRRQAMHQSKTLLTAARGGSGKLFLNCSAHAFGDSELIEDLVQGSAALGLRPASIVLEVTERVAITEWQAFRRALEKVRAAGLQVAIDDMGAGYSSLNAVGEIQPDYLKFDHSLIHGIQDSAIKRDLFETLATLARKIGARAIAEGIEQPEELEVVRTMGVTLGQGYLFARPTTPQKMAGVHFPAD